MEHEKDTKVNTGSEEPLNTSTQLLVSSYGENFWQQVKLVRSLMKKLIITAKNIRKLFKKKNFHQRKKN